MSKAQKHRRDKRHRRHRSVSGSRTSSHGPRASRRRLCSWRALTALGTKKGTVEAMLVIDVQPAVGKEDSCDEGWLVAKAKSGHEGALGELYKRHQPRTYRTALRILRKQQDAEDAVQMAFQRALVNLQRFREDSTF